MSKTDTELLAPVKRQRQEWLLLTWLDDVTIDKTLVIQDQYSMTELPVAIVVSFRCWSIVHTAVYS